MPTQEAYDHLLERIARLEQRDAAGHMVGAVHERDHDKGVRLNFGEDSEGKPFLSPWIQPPDRTGNSRYLPPVGAQYSVSSHGGDWRQAQLHPLTHSDAKPNPATHADEAVIFQSDDKKIRLSVDQKAKTVTFKNDKSTTTWYGDKTTIDQDGKTTTYEADKVTFPDGSKLRHGQKNIGKDHIHGGVMPGGGKTRDPDE